MAPQSVLARKVMKEVLARLNAYPGGRIGAARHAGALLSGCDGVPMLTSSGCSCDEAWAWCPNCYDNAITYRRDLREPVSSFISAMVGKASPDLSHSALSPAPGTPGCGPARAGTTTIAAHGRSREGRAGRSWVQSDAPNLCGVERNLEGEGLIPLTPALSLKGGEGNV